MIPLQTASPHPVTHIVFSPDGSAVAVAQPHYGVTILDRATGGTIAVCAMPRRAALTGLTFCGGGRYLAAAHARGLEVFDAATGARAVGKIHSPRRYQLAARGDLLLGAAPGYTALRGLLKATDGALAPVSSKALVCRGDLTFAACAPDGSHVLGAARDRFVLMNVAADRPVAAVEYPAGERPANRVVKFCPFGKRFALGDGRTIEVYDTAALADEGEEDQPADTPLVQRDNGTRTAVAPMPHTVLSPVFALKPADDKTAMWYPPFALLADGRGLLVKRPRNRVQLWDAPTGTLVNEWSWRFEWVTCVAVCADGLTAVAGGRFGRVLLWDLE